MLGDAYSLVDLLVGSVIGYSAYVGASVATHAHVQQCLGLVQARPATQNEGCEPFGWRWLPSRGQVDGDEAAELGLTVERVYAQG